MNRRGFSLLIALVMLVLSASFVHANPNSIVLLPTTP